MYSTCLFCSRDLGANEALEIAWRRAEEIAAISDDLLLPEGTALRLEELKERAAEED